MIRITPFEYEERKRAGRNFRSIEEIKEEELNPESLVLITLRSEEP